MKKIIMLFLVIILVLAGCGVEELRSLKGKSSSEITDGISVEIAILSHVEVFDETVIEAKITNDTDEAFKGIVDIFDGSFNFKHWEISIDTLAPNSSIKRQTKTSYIEKEKLNFSHKVKGEFFEPYQSEVDYEILYQPEGTYAFYVQVDEVTEEIAVSIVKDLYSKYGTNLGRVAIYDSTLDEEIEDGLVFPVADFFNNMLGYSLTFYDENEDRKVELELP